MKTMMKGKSLLIGAGISVAIVILLICGMGAFDVKALSKTPDQTPPYMFRPDIITFDTMKVFGKLEKPTAVFLHDQHTDTLEKKNKDCMTCHKAEDGRMSPKFMRLKDISREELTKIYCDNCTKCHTEILAAGEKAGPTKCDECHKERPLIKSSRMPFGFDKSLHYRHYKAQKNKCERCHHEYDQKNKKLFYAKNKEGTCRYCHKKETQELDSEKRISMRLASHFACIDCHLKNIAKNIGAGPVTCGGCHDIEQQKKIDKVDKVPRIKRKQPDIVLIKTGDNKGLQSQMYRVPFGHKAHERYNDTCRVCHHADLKSCVSCHTLTGSKEGQYVKLKDAMHQLDTKQSCMGCHEANMSNKACAGCHASMEKDRKQDSAACMKCHMAPPKNSTGVLYQAGERKLARMMPEIWQAIFGTKHDNVDIPKKVVIKELSDRYEPVEFPHRKIFQALKKKINNNKMATYFHPVEATLCQGCHHNSPAAGKPAKCGSCHGKPFNEKHLFMPGLKGAYHLQCMGCHNEMGIEKPANVDCKGCHIEKNSKPSVEAKVQG
jgi:hypothetical protein